jgi:hypothetical protein
MGLNFDGEDGASIPKSLGKVSGGISMASDNILSFKSKSKEPVPRGGRLAKMRFSLIPLSSSDSAKEAASVIMSTVSSKEHLISGPEPARLIP